MINSAVLACVLRRRLKRKGRQLFEEKNAPPSEKLLATSMNNISLDKEVPVKYRIRGPDHRGSTE